MRVLVVDDHEIIRRGVIMVLNSRPEYTVAAEAVNGEDAIQKAQAIRPDIIIMDISMPKLNGIEATRAIVATLPAIRVLILSQHHTPEMVQQAFNAGAQGYVMKSSLGDNLLRALDAVSQGKLFVDPQLNSRQKVPQIDVEEILQRGAAFEQALRDSEERFRTTFEQAAVGMAHVAVDGRLLRVNQKLADILGYTKEELQQKTWMDLTHPDDLSVTTDHVQELLHGMGESYQAEKRYARKDGSVAWCSLTLSLRRDSQGKPLHFLGVLMDISDRKQSDEMRSRLAAIVESSDDAIISKTSDGVISSWNRSAQRIFGYTEEEAVGQPITLIIPPERRDEEKQILSRLLAGERVDHYETVRLAKSGTRLNVSLTISPVVDSRGRIVGASKIARVVKEVRHGGSEGSESAAPHIPPIV